MATGASSASSTSDESKPPSRPPQQQPQPQLNRRTSWSTRPSITALPLFKASSSTSDKPPPPPPPLEPPVAAPSPSQPSPAPLRRALSFKLPVRVNTDPASFPAKATPTSNRNRSISLPEPSPKLVPPSEASPAVEDSSPRPPPLLNKRRNRLSVSRFSLSSIGEFPSPLPSATSQYPDEGPSSSSTPTTPTSKFLQDRGLLPSSAATDEPSSEEDFTFDPSSRDLSVQDLLTKYLATMSSPQKGQDQVAQAYPQQYQQQNPNMKMNMPNLPIPMPNLSGVANGAAGNLVKGPIGPDGKLRDAALLVGIKLDLEAEVHLTARVRGDILVGLY